MNNKLVTTSRIDDSKWEIMQIRLNDRVVKSAADEPFSVVDGVGGIYCHYIPCSFTNETLALVKDHTGWCGFVTMVIFNDLYLAITKYTNTGVSSAQINTNSWGMIRNISCHIFLQCKSLETNNI